MAKKTVHAKKAPAKKSNHYVVHKRLEEPVHNLLSYSVLLALALVVLMLVLKIR